MSKNVTLLAVSLAASVPLALIVGFAATFALVFAIRRRRIVGTTLSAPWLWTLVSFGSLCGVELAIALMRGAAPSWAPSLRYVAAMSTFCPVMALLGAKRPQDRGWQWIVLSLWAILCQPAAEWLLFGGVAEIHPARFWFLVILMLVGATNGLGTRFWLSSLLYGAGQLALLLPYFSADTSLNANHAALAGSGAILGSWLLATVGIWPGRRAHLPLDRAWLDFRDAFGVVWGLRIVERMNTSAKMYDWPVTLTWHGFAPRTSSKYDEVPTIVDESFRTLLRRFVSPEWIDARVSQTMVRSETETSVVS